MEIFCAFFFFFCSSFDFSTSFVCLPQTSASASAFEVACDGGYFVVSVAVRGVIWSWTNPICVIIIVVQPKHCDATISWWSLCAVRNWFYIFSFCSFKMAIESCSFVHCAFFHSCYLRWISCKMSKICFLFFGGAEGKFSFVPNMLNSFAFGGDVKLSLCFNTHEIVFRLYKFPYANRIHLFNWAYTFLKCAQKLSHANWMNINYKWMSWFSYRKERNERSLCTMYIQHVKTYLYRRHGWLVRLLLFIHLADDLILWICTCWHKHIRTRPNDCS